MRPPEKIMVKTKSIIRNFLKGRFFLERGYAVRTVIKIFTPVPIIVRMIVNIYPSMSLLLPLKSQAKLSNVILPGITTTDVGFLNMSKFGVKEVSRTIKIGTSVTIVTNVKNITLDTPKALSPKLNLLTPLYLLKEHSPTF